MKRSFRCSPATRTLISISAMSILRDKRYDDALIHYEKAGKLGLAALRMDNYYFNLSVCYAGLGGWMTRSDLLRNA